jgi:NTP pyrophosphatase (non-canonical NTP hydrolase)
MKKQLKRKASFRQLFFQMLEQEVERAYRKHGRLKWGRHEFYGIIKEEVDEMWDAIKTNQPDDALAGEIIQVAAMCLRFLETGDRYKSRKATQ